MRKISTSGTIFLKLVLPIFWLVFFGSITVALFIYSPEGLNTTGSYFKWIWIFGWMFHIALFLVFGFVGWTALLYFTVFQLKRVEGDEKGLFISNYFRHVYIAFESIDKFEDTNLGPFLWVRVSFSRPTYFGKRIHFLASKTRFNLFVEENADQIQSEA